MKHSRHFGSASRLLALCACVAVLGGCASAITSEALVPASISTAKKHPGTVSVAVDGGKETDSMGKPQVSNDAMRQALAEAITKSQTFSKVIEGSGGRYVLTVSMFNLDQPSFGAAFTVKMEAGWTLKRADTGATVWQESIKSEHTATMGDAMAGMTRLRLATEGAARNNIANGLAKISQLNL
jgi:hypothetical protein